MRGWIVLLIWVSCLTNVYADSIDWSHPDVDRLRTAINSRINQFRLSNKLTTLEDDSILDLAAQNQANYCRSAQRVRHDQPKAQLADTRKRVQFYGGQYRTLGENAGSFTVGRKAVFRWDTGDTTVIIDTYEKAAEWFFHLWRLSPVHRSNLLYPNLNRSGLGFAYDPTNQVFYAVHVLGRI